MNPGDPLTEGWRWTTLGEVARITASNVDKKSKDDEIPIKLCNYRDVGSNRFIHANIRFMAATATEREISRNSLKIGDVLMTKDSEVGSVALVEEDIPDLVCGYHVAIMRPNYDIIDSRYLLYALEADYAQDQIRSKARGLTILGIKMGEIASVGIPLPPLAEQRRIEAALEARLAAAEQARRAALSQLNALEAMPAALLRKVFEREAKIRFWPRVEISEICIQDRSMVSIDHPEYAEIPYLGLEHVEEGTGRILVTKEQAMTSDSISNNFLFTPEHVLYGKLRPYLNKVALPEFAGRCTTEIIPLRPTHVDRRWLAWFLRREDTVAFAMRSKTGSRMPRASMRELMRLPIPLPPPEEQRRIVAELERELTAVERVRTAARERLTLAEALPGAILRRAFAPGASA